MIISAPGAVRPHTHFVVPDGCEARVPPEQRGTGRDDVRLLVATADGLAHRRFGDLPHVLASGDLLVINTSATVPAAVTGQREDGRPVLVHVSSWLDSAAWIVEVRTPGNRGPDLVAEHGEELRLPGGVTLTLEQPYPDASARPSRLWVSAVQPVNDAVAYLTVHGQPIAYGHIVDGLPLSDHQTVYAEQPGSAEMPSAGRPFTSELLVRLITAGVTVAPLTLHAGVSSPEFHEPPAPERYSVPETTARLVVDTARAGKRVVAVGTTVVRALETIADTPDLGGRSGWTDLVLGPHHPARVVSGLITGLHIPESSHLLLLEAVAGAQLVDDAYAAAVERGYLWHEFGDSMLFLP